VSVDTPTVAVWKLASCDGCQLTLLDCEDELLAIADRVDLTYFLEAGFTSVRASYDLSLVEGSITTADDARRIQEIRRVSRMLITIGACATAGGIQALRNFGEVDELRAIVYAHPELVETLATSTPIAAHVAVDFELRGCPISKVQLVDTISAFLHGRRPNVSSRSVCAECKERGNTCVVVAHGAPCLGPITHAGCTALCPSYNRGCFGCYGPGDTANVTSLIARLRSGGVGDDDIVRYLRTFNAYADELRTASGALTAAVETP